VHRRRLPLHRRERQIRHSQLHCLACSTRIESKSVRYSPSLTSVGLPTTL
jgi:hypothetical protein